MYRVILIVDGTWMEWNKYETSPDAWDCIEAMGNDRAIKLVGPNGEWYKPQNKTEFTYTEYNICKNDR